ncbi:MAG: cyclic nucleotide-binding domain-containing protein, partial [Verrucomicrobiota bacterium]
FAYIHEEGKIPDEMRGLPFLESFKKQHLDDILYSSSLMECEDGDVIIEEGGSGSRIYILLSGAVEISKAGETLARLRGHGDTFGELAALGDELRSATVRAQGKAILLAVDQKFLQDTKPREKNPEFYAAFYEFLARITATRLKATSEELSRLERQLHDAQEQLRAVSHPVG